MKKSIVQFVITLSLGLSLLSQISTHAIAPHIEAVWANEEVFERQFSNKTVTILWRGTHFLRNNFPDEASRERYWKNQDVMIPIYSAAAHELSRVPYGAKLSTRQSYVLFNNATDIQQLINSLSSIGQFTVNGNEFETYRYAFQHFYSNDYDLFHRILSADCPRKYGALSASLSFSRNPFVSCTTSIVHAAKYGSGLKYYGEHARVLTPNYKISGRPTNPWLGVLHGIILDRAMVEETIPFNVYAHHQAGNIKVSTHWSCNILTEEEVSLVGRIPENAVVVKYPLTVTTFEDTYAYTPDYDGEVYALSKQRYNNMKEVVQSKKRTKSYKNGRVKSMMEQIISPKNKDKAHMYRNTIAEKLPKEMKRKLRNIGASIRAITVDGTFAS